MDKEEFRLRKRDFIPFKGVGEYGDRNGYYDPESGRGDVFMRKVSTRVHNRILLLCTYNAAVAVVSTAVYLQKNEIMQTIDNLF